MCVFKEVKEKISLKEVGELYCSFNDRGFCYSPVVLKEEGRQEKTPSFTYSEDLGIFKCFSSGWAGDAIAFVALMEDLSMKEAARFISNKFNLGVDFRDDRSQQLYRANKEVIDEAHRLITPEARKYLNDRGITDHSIEEFKLGYLNGYIYMPLRNSSGQIAAINKRRLDGSGPKYVHSEESAVFKKSKFLANLDKAKKLKSQDVIITEGFFDCIQAWQFGWPCVAALSTNITKDHIKKILKYFNSITLAFDEDSAGDKATIKVFKLIKSISPETVVTIMTFRGEKDLGDYFLRQSLGDPDYCSFYEWAANRKMPLKDLLHIAAFESSAINLKKACKEVAYHYKQDVEDILYDVRTLQGFRVKKPENKKKFRYT